MNTGSTREQVDLKRLILIDKKIDKLLLTKIDLKRFLEEFPSEKRVNDIENLLANL